MRFRFSLLADYTVPSAFIPLSLLAFRVQVSAYSTKKQCRTIWHIAASVSITFARSVRLQSYPRPRTSTSSRFLFVRTLSASSIPFVHVFPVLFPRTQTGYECVFLFFSLSQFYGCRNPRWRGRGWPESKSRAIRQCDVAHKRGCISNQATDTYLRLSHMTAWRVGQPNTPCAPLQTWRCPRRP